MRPIHSFFRLRPRPAHVLEPFSGPRRFGDLARQLELLASEPRLELLHELRTPRELNEIRVGAGFTREGENPERPLSRQAVTRHLEQLVEAGLVHRLEARPSGHRGDQFIISHERLFAMVDELRNLSKLRPILAGPLPVLQTVVRGESRGVNLPELPRMLVAYGRDDGVAFWLGDGERAAFTVGRAADCDIRLDYDPYLSSHHAILTRTPEGFTVVDSASRNGTWVNWSRLRPDAPLALASGDLLMVGRSILAFQA